MFKDKVFEVKSIIKTWLKLFNNRYRDKRAHINETNEQRMRRLVSDRNQHMFTRSIESDTLQCRYQLIFVSNRLLLRH